MRHRNSRVLLRYWDGLRGLRAAPFRAEVDPREIASVLNNAFILERISEGDIRFRLAGSSVCAGFGIELRGMSALVFWQGKCRERAGRLLERVMLEPCVGRIGCTAETPAGYLVDVEMLYLPLRSDSGKTDRILGVINYFGEEELNRESPRYLRHWVERVERRSISVATDDNLLNGSQRTAEAGASFRAKIPVLRVIQGGRSRSLSANEGSDSKSRKHLRLAHGEQSGS